MVRSRGCLAAAGCAAALLCARASLGQAAEAVEVYARGDYAGVVKLLGPSHKAGTAKIQERLLLARAYLHLGQGDDGLAVLRSVLDSDRENPEANSLTGQVLQGAGKHAEALPYLEHGWRLKQDPATAAALGQCHYALGHLTKAKAFLQAALKHDVRNPSTSFLLGRICLERGLGALAEKYLLMAQEAGLDSPELHLLLGRAYLLQRKLLGPVLVRRITPPPKPGQLVEGHVVLAAIEGVADTYQVCTRFSALYEGSVLLEAEPRHPDALYMAAAGWLAAGDTKLADKHLAELRQREPDSRRVAELQARMLLAARRFAPLVACLDEAHAKKLLDPPALADLCYQAALTLRALGNYDEAMRFLKKAEHHAPVSAEVLHSLAGLCAATGRRDEAARYYTRMVELFPDAPDADEWRNALAVLQQDKGGQP